MELLVKSVGRWTINDHVSWAPRIDSRLPLPTATNTPPPTRSPASDLGMTQTRQRKKPFLPGRLLLAFVTADEADPAHCCLLPALAHQPVPLRLSHNRQYWPLRCSRRLSMGTPRVHQSVRRRSAHANPAPPRAACAPPHGASHHPRQQVASPRVPVRGTDVAAGATTAAAGVAPCCPGPPRPHWGGGTSDPPPLSDIVGRAGGAGANQQQRHRATAQRRVPTSAGDR